MLLEKTNAVSAQAKTVAKSVEAAPTSVPSVQLLEELERKCKSLEQACNENSS